jgi:hypothetical protein
MQKYPQCRTPNNACRAELGRCPLNIKIQKRAIQFYNHLKGNNSQTLHKSHHLQRGEPGEESPKQAGPGALFKQPTEPQDSNTIRPEQITRKQQERMLSNVSSHLKKQSKLECNLALNRVHSGRILDHCD